MVRYTGQDLGKQPKIAVISNDAIGNFVIVTPLIQMLRQKWPDAHILFCNGSRTKELGSHFSLVDRFYELYGTPPHLIAFDLLSFRRGRDFELVINVEQGPVARVAAAILAGDDGYVVGPCAGRDSRESLPFQADERGALWEDKDWKSEDTPKRYPFLKTGWIGEIFCRSCYLTGDIPPYSVPFAIPDIHVPEVLISTAASLPEKLWPIEKWMRLLEHLKERNVTVGLLGAPPKVQGAHWKGADEEEQLVTSGLVIDLRGKLTMPQVGGALAITRTVVTIDNGILHLACAAEAPTVGLFRHGIHRLWAPPNQHLEVLTSGSENIPVSEISFELVRDITDVCLQNNPK